MRTLLRCSPSALLLIAACAGTAGSEADDSDNLSPAQVSATPQLRVAHTMPVGGESTVSVRTLPNATCTLRPASEAPGAREHLRIYSDDDGIARVHLQDKGGVAQKGALALDCADEQGRTFTHALDVTTAAGVRGQRPAPYATAGKRTLPALEGVDPLSLSEVEIIARGYPPRPDASAARRAGSDRS